MNKRRDRLLVALMLLCALVACGVLLWILGFVLLGGLPAMTITFMRSLAPQALATLYLTFGALIIAMPIGVGCAVYLSEYAHQNRLLAAIRFAIQCLASIPSIIYGLFGMVFFGIAFKWGFSLLTGMLTVSIMVLPTLIATTEEALRAVPMTLREGSLALGAGKLRTTLRIVLPCALPGILTAAILSIGRIVGETAAIYLTVGTMLKIPHSVMSSGRTLSVHLYLLAKEAVTPDAFSQAYATAALLMILVVGINLMVRLSSGKNRAA